MNKWIRVFSLTLALITLAATASAAGEKQVFEGEYDWVNGNRGALKVELKEKGPETWKVAFYFKFGKKSHVYKGTATGDLAGGQLEGSVRGGGKKRVFSGQVKDGVLQASHAEILSSGKEQHTGTFEVTPSRHP